MTWLVGNPRFSLVVENRFWLVNGAGPIRPWSDFVGCDRVSRGWEQWGVSRTRLSWPMCWVLGAWFNMAKNVVLLCKVPVDKRFHRNFAQKYHILCHIEPGTQNPTHGPREPRSGNTPLFPTTWHTITPDKIRSWPNRPCPINQSESILNNQWKSRISDQSGHRIPHQLNLIGY